MMHSAMARLVILAAAVLGQVGLASAAPTCTRVASQWAVVFPAECTMWSQQVGRQEGPRPDSCSQVCTWLGLNHCLRVALLLHVLVSLAQ